ncbi:hypothetical protein ACFLWY_01880 [Chloroflexota bacterium]
MMRKLYLIPIIHMSADMGSLASTLDERASDKLRPEIWQKHKEIVAAFWDAIGRFLDSLNVNGFRVYQDGLVADGAEGLRIVREGITQGSKNYEIFGKLLERGAVLMKTEDLSLAKKEYNYIAKVTGSKSRKEKEAASLRYKLVQGKLLKQRDEFIAKRIEQSLGEGENGILFIGAYHNVVPNLPADIKVVQVKEVAKIREYHKVLISKGRHDQYLQELSEYLVSPISTKPF